MNRRLLLKYMLGSGLALTAFSRVPLVEAVYFVSQAKLKNLPYFLDTLIPPDETPSAAQLGVHERLIKQAAQIKNYPELLELGCRWLGPGFHNLSPEEREAVVQRAERFPEGTITRMFFERVRHDSMQIYYGLPRSWIGLGIDRSPQPQGYPLHQFAPEKS